MRRNRVQERASTGVLDCILGNVRFWRFRVHALREGWPPPAKAKNTPAKYITGRFLLGSGAGGFPRLGIPQFVRCERRMAGFMPLG